MTNATLRSASTGLVLTEVILEYVRRLEIYKKQKPYLLAYDIPVQEEGPGRTNLELEDISVAAHDLRPIVHQIQLEDCGFELLNLSTHTMEELFTSGYQQSEAEGVRQLLLERFSAEEVIIFDHAYRKEELRSKEHQYSFENRPAQSIVVRNPHADQSPQSGLARICQFLTPEERITYGGDGWRMRIIK
ncbi:hypothetical protein BDW59DRAFT_156637 [Aspergillus cavernicola]|uniref:Uncharacterized protein n=1 Tax=Aspergillus cavernicola TaxID=176166 RepID=A0ABR4J1C1_9EURO